VLAWASGDTGEATTDLMLASTGVSGLCRVISGPHVYISRPDWLPPSRHGPARAPPPGNCGWQERDAAGENALPV
ncbi:MAG: hypothetical protein QME93_08260, partial [Bacillota bacterium]|nr:hypothetical protein [Bacillota bacterium]